MIANRSTSSTPPSLSLILITLVLLAVATIINTVSISPITSAAWAATIETRERITEPLSDVIFTGCGHPNTSIEGKALFNFIEFDNGHFVFHLNSQGGRILDSNGNLVGTIHLNDKRVEGKSLPFIFHNEFVVTCKGSGQVHLNTGFVVDKNGKVHVIGHKA